MDHQDVIIEPSKWDGRHITYIDRFKLIHTGNVIGQEPGGKILFIQSDKKKIAKATWHFTIDSRIINAVLDKKVVTAPYSIRKLSPRRKRAI